MAYPDWTTFFVQNGGVVGGVSQPHAGLAAPLTALMTCGALCRSASASAGTTDDGLRMNVSKPSLVDVDAQVISISAALRWDGNLVAHSGIVMNIPVFPGNNPHLLDGGAFLSVGRGNATGIAIEFIQRSGAYAVDANLPAGQVVVAGYAPGTWILLRITKTKLGARARYDFYKAAPSDNPTWALIGSYTPLSPQWVDPTLATEWPNHAVGFTTKNWFTPTGDRAYIDMFSVDVTP